MNENKINMGESALRFTPNGNGTCHISGSVACAGAMEIPFTYGGERVTGIGELAFYKRTELTSVLIPEGVTSIGDNAFQGCNKLTSVEIPDTVKSIGELAFYNCSSLKNIRFMGTKEQWNAISKENDWNLRVPSTVQYDFCEQKKISGSKNIPGFHGTPILPGKSDFVIGNTIQFGSYNQSGAAKKEPIEWLVLDIQDEKALVISKYALDCKRYNETNTKVTWETCTLRKWLNNNFLNSAFSASEKSKIPTVTVSADANPSYSTNPGNATEDQIFLLSITEAKKYFSSDSARECQPTAYAKAQGARRSSSSTYAGNCRWWLRSPGNTQRNAASVYIDGYVDYLGDRVDYSYGAVRPALWIDLKS